MFIAQVTASFKNDFITILAQNAEIKHLQKQRFICLLKLTSFFKIKILTFKKQFILCHSLSKEATFNIMSLHDYGPITKFYDVL
jgi:hypothetical protein